MILYFSAGTHKDYFRLCQEQGLVKSGYQAQKFNQLVMEGMGHATSVTSIGNLPFSMGISQEIQELTKKEGTITYIALGCRPGKLRKLHNFRDAWRHGAEVCEGGQIQGIVCDGVNPLAALLTRMLGKRYGIPAICIMTDVPGLLSEHPSAFQRLDEKLARRFDGYVLLTEAMNAYVNPHNKPFIVMEGLCDFSQTEAVTAEKREKTCLYTGSLSPGTGIEALVEGFAKYRPEGYTLQLYGSGPLAESLKGREKDGIYYCGAVSNEEIVRRQRQASLLINPRPVGLKYNITSFPSKIMEYMASSTPVLTTVLPGIPKEYFSYVYMAPDDSADGLGREIARILTLPEEERLSLAQEAREFVMEKKNNVYQAGRILELIRKCNQDKGERL